MNSGNRFVTAGQGYGPADVLPGIDESAGATLNIARPSTRMGLTSVELEFAAHADNTRRAYESDLACYRRWCSAEGIKRPLPANPHVVALYLAAKAGDLAVSSLARRLAAIKSWHFDHDKPPPQSGELRRVWAGIRRTLGRPPMQKKALVLEDLIRVVDAVPKTRRGLRDRALLLLWFAGALRRSEIAPLELESDKPGRVLFIPGAEGAEIFIRRSKTDQEGHGAVVAVPYTGSPFCPVTAVLTWLREARIESGPIFQAVDRWGNLSGAPITDNAAAQIVKNACTRAGLDSKAYAGHSLRRGFITTAARRGAKFDELRRHARHSNIQTTLRYIEAAGRFEDNLAGRIGL
jgi:site-specific recombinase XerD